MKRIISITLSLLFVVSLFSFTACGKKEEASNPPAVTEQAPQQGGEQGTQAEEEAPDDEKGDEEAPAE